MEIERKWRLRNLPPMLELEIAELEVFQAYVSIPNFENEMRIRRLTNLYNSEIQYCLTFKTNESLSRQELEMVIPSWLFESLAQTTTKQLLKSLSFVYYGNHRLEFHIYKDDNLAGLIIMECEFKTEYGALSFVPPNWLDIEKEVTNDPRYKNINLASAGMPQN